MEGREQAVSGEAFIDQLTAAQVSPVILITQPSQTLALLSSGQQGSPQMSESMFEELFS